MITQCENVYEFMDDQPLKEIFFLRDYNWERGYLINEGPKNLKVKHAVHGYEVRVPKNKCALPDEIVCIVWEMWRGKNGRGGYRVERMTYTESRVRADNVSRQHVGQGRVVETSEVSVNDNQY